MITCSYPRMRVDFCTPTDRWYASWTVGLEKSYVMTVLVLSSHKEYFFGSTLSTKRATPKQVIPKSIPLNFPATRRLR